MKNETEEERFSRYKTELIKIIKTHLPSCKIYLFGSRARNEHDEGADIDLAIDSGNKLGFRGLYKIKDDIEESRVPLCVDLVDLRDVGDDLKREIEREGVLWET